MLSFAEPEVIAVQRFKFATTFFGRVSLRRRWYAQELSRLEQRLRQATHAETVAGELPA